MTPWREKVLHDNSMGCTSIRHAKSPQVPGSSLSLVALPGSGAIERAMLPGFLEPNCLEPKKDPSTHPQAFSRAFPSALPSFEYPPPGWMTDPTHLQAFSRLALAL